MNAAARSPGLWPSRILMVALVLAGGCEGRLHSPSSIGRPLKLRLFRPESPSSRKFRTLHRNNLRLRAPRAEQESSASSIEANKEGSKPEHGGKNTYFMSLGVNSYIDYDKTLSENPEIRSKQKQYIRSKMKEGDLVAYGPLRGLIFPPTLPQDVGLWMIKADSPEEATRIMDESPYCASEITHGCKLVHVNSASKESQELEHRDILGDIQEQIDEVQADVQASLRVQGILKNELESAHAELKAARQKYDKYNREINLQRFDWLSSGSINTLRKLQPVYDALEQLQSESKASTQSEGEIEAMFQTIARDFINVYEQEIDCVGGEDGLNPIHQWVTKVFGAPSDISSGGSISEEGSDQH